MREGVGAMVVGGFRTARGRTCRRGTRDPRSSGSRSPGDSRSRRPRPGSSSPCTRSSSRTPRMRRPRPGCLSRGPHGHRGIDVDPSSPAPCAVAPEVASEPASTPEPASTSMTELDDEQPMALPTSHSPRDTQSIDDSSPPSPNSPRRQGRDPRLLAVRRGEDPGCRSRIDRTPSGIEGPRSSPRRKSSAR